MGGVGGFRLFLVSCLFLDEGVRSLEVRFFVLRLLWFFFRV